MVLEEIEAGSIKVWLRNILSSTDDQALKGLDWKPAVGKYLVRAKYAYLKWSNREGADGSLTALGREIQSIAKETDVLHLPDYSQSQPYLFVVHPILFLLPIMLVSS